MPRAKPKQKNVPKESDNESTSNEEGRIHIDIATVKKPKRKGLEDVKVSKPQWQIKVDARTQHKTSRFFAKKSDQVEETCVQFKKWIDAKVPVKLNVRMRQCMGKQEVAGASREQ